MVPRFYMHRSANVRIKRVIKERQPTSRPTRDAPGAKERLFLGAFMRLTKSASESSLDTVDKHAQISDSFYEWEVLRGKDENDARSLIGHQCITYS